MRENPPGDAPTPDDEGLTEPIGAAAGSSDEGWTLSASGNDEDWTLSESEPFDLEPQDEWASADDARLNEPPLTAETATVVSIPPVAASASVGSSFLPAGATAPARSGGDEPPHPPSHRSGGIGAVFARNPKTWLIAASVAVFAVFGSGAVALGAAVASPDAGTPIAALSESSTPSPTVTTPPPRPVPAAELPASALRTCSVAGLLNDSRFGTLQAQVLNAATGELLFERDPATASQTASSMKVLTAAAALSVLGPDFRASTRVVTGSEPGTIVLVGGGDLTLTRLPTGQEPVYTGAAHLDDLASQAKAAYEAANPGTPITRIVLDSSYFSGKTWGDTWPATERGTGWLSHITALQVDADRANPQVFLSPRGEDPIGRAGSAFASYFGNVATEQGTAPAGAAELASVSSQPLSTLIPQALIPSDNSLAEMIGRHVAIKLGLGNSIDAIAAAIPQGLEAYGIDTSGLRTADASGMSRNNAVPPSYFTQLFLKINAREGNLGIIRDGLPVAGESGTLNYSNRFFGANAVSRGHIRAKSGSISSAYTLTGIIDAVDGSTLIFAIYATGNVGSGARTAIDTLATGFYKCGANLSNT
ncbi:D-alanyl-D-alanine carboxypeptidase/D-alanyl-D-alanine-endopeptidase (penicillin-binding protein 4) [Okibacterium sp. HSC-33S16]|uniref:D-alanyl-D-alanine carboxypeptidase/D-alanyl-D-alanine-endopeptidase n=1 Tax=Okibacterium sp. HSC-33S16 TaxID=2910965 RepID=UPI00209E082A|nr:D-alanyl-D-alanine carboxypeptidase [Okibacterium sp. HSC-33S16]MCP2032235.1 D-alanyl-D-alanine carboxypeptidase/D-alanyl-D-alanine-endopeptidase (penicillin-binding protein 4) [Okibacterium sp. HSC-33S16]